ncbi:MAG TPA: ABC transporter permease, partial [Dehalococcoidia bacterium]|nr:ABC transporter permease [Dehalococcoidia bacterium]
KSATGATAASAALRVNASYSPKQFTSVDSSVLAIDPQTFGSVAYWRGDFSPHSLSSIDRTLQQNSLSQPAGIDLPDGARGLGVWVQTPTNSPGYQLAARLIDARGRVVDYGLFAGQNAQPAPGDWQFYVAPLDRPGIGISQRPGPAPTQPLRLLDVYIRDRPTQQEQTVTDYLQGLQITTDGTLQTGPDGFANGTPLDDFSNLSKFEAIPSEGNPDNADVLSKAPVQRAGQPAVQISWHRGQSDPGLHGFRLRGDGKPLMVYADSDFLNQTGLHTGSRAAMFIDDVTVETQIAGTFSYFPSFPADGRSHLLVVDLARLQAEVLRTPNPGNLVLPDELWLAGGGAGAADAQDLTSKGFTADTVLSLAQIRAGQQRDPLVAASWEGILFLSFAAVLVLAALGFAVYSYLTAQGRTLEFAVLRTMGLSHAQIAVVVAFEQAFVVATGIIAGTILGLPLSRVMIGFMGITETGDKVVPPMVGSVSWQAAAGAYAGLALVLIAVVASLVLLYGRLSVSRALRMGEV